MKFSINIKWEIKTIGTSWRVRIHAVEPPFWKAKVSIAFSGRKTQEDRLSDLIFLRVHLNGVVAGEMLPPRIQLAVK